MDRGGTSPHREAAVTHVQTLLPVVEEVSTCSKVPIQQKKRLFSPSKNPNKFQQNALKASKSKSTPSSVECPLLLQACVELALTTLYAVTQFSPVAPNLGLRK